MFNTLSGRFLILTIVFVMLAEVLIFVPSIARFRLDYLNTRIERAQIASLALLADDMLAPELEAELLQNAGVYNVVLLRNETRRVFWKNFKSAWCVSLSNYASRNKNRGN